MGDARQLRFELHLAEGVGPYEVLSVKALDRVSTPYRYEIEFLAEAENIDLDDCLTTEASLTIEDPSGTARSLHGVIEEISVFPGRWDERTAFHIMIVPEAHLLRYRHGSRVFTDLSAPDVCRRIFAGAGVSSDRLEWRLSATYPARDLCVQYDESEWDFVSRLLEEEGIYYRFEHETDGHRMIFEDKSSRAPRGRPDPLVFDPDPDLERPLSQAYRVEATTISVEDRVELCDLDEIRPGLSLRFDENAEGSTSSGREWYEYPGGHGDEATGRRFARTRLEELRGCRDTFKLATTAFTAQAGQRIVVVGAPVDVPDGFIVENDLRITRDGEEWDVSNDLVLIPEDRPYRPSRVTPQPVVHGVETARVTGPPGSECHIDEFGRVKVQFHWDREGQLDARSSCWVPVVQGHTTGAIMHPRVGWEVVVEFRDGDPDRPVVTGRVYNPLFPPPHALPERCTVTAHRSDSLPGRQRINEVRFEDLAGKEHIAVTAGYDLRQVAVVDRHIRVSHNENRAIGVDRTEVIGVLQRTLTRSNRSDSVAMNQRVAIGNDRSVLIRKSASEMVRHDLSYTVGTLSYAQVGEAVPGALRTRVRQSSEGPASVLMEGLEGLMTQVWDAAAAEVGEAGVAQTVLADDPPPTDLLGSVMGGLDDPPELPAAEQESLSEGIDGAGEAASGAGETLGQVGEAASSIGDAASRVGETIESASAIAEGIQQLAEGVEGVVQGLDAVGGIVDAVDGALDDGLGAMALEGASALLGAVDDEVSGLLDELGGASAAVRGALAGASEATQVAGQAAKLAEGASSLVSDPSATSALEALHAVGGAGLPGALGDAVEGVSNLAGDATSAWDAASGVVGDLTSTITALSTAFSEFGAVFQEGGEGATTPNPYEQCAVHFGAAVANAILRGTFAEQADETDEDSSEEGEATEDSESASTAEGDEAHPEPGDGTWSVTVGGDATENVAGVSVTGSGAGYRIAVGGRSVEVARVARVMQVGGNSLEQTDGSKTESTGRYVVVAGEGVNLSAGGAAQSSVDGAASVKVSGSMTVEAGGALKLQGATTEIGASEAVVFECGSARVTVNGDGIAIEGSQIVVRGDVIGVDSPALG